MSDNFYIYTMSDGKIPVLRRKAWFHKAWPYFVRYLNNIPVSYKLPPGETRVYNYNKQEYEPIDPKKIAGY